MHANGHGTPNGDGSRAMDAIALMKADHRRIEAWLQRLQKLRDKDSKAELAWKVCEALRVHAQIEEEIFHPAFLAATGRVDICRHAEVEHEGAGELVAELELSSPRERCFDARVAVLAGMMRHHIEEEEKPGGMFAAAKRSKLDLTCLGRQLFARKRQLEGDPALIETTRKKPPSQVAFSESARRTGRSPHSFVSSEGDARR